MHTINPFVKKYIKLSYYFLVKMDKSKRQGVINTFTRCNQVKTSENQDSFPTNNYNFETYYLTGSVFDSVLTRPPETPKEHSKALIT